LAAGWRRQAGQESLSIDRWNESRSRCGGRFREDLLARHTAAEGRRVTLNREARTRFLRFATTAGTPWRVNFRDFAAAVARKVTMASMAC
jgi:hypothetical protein